MTLLKKNDVRKNYFELLTRKCLRSSLNLIWIRQWGFLHPYWFSLIGSETVKSIALLFCSIQCVFSGDIHAKFGIPNSPQSPDIKKKTHARVILMCGFLAKSLLNKSCCNSRTSNDIVMKLQKLY